MYQIYYIKFVSYLIFSYLCSKKEMSNKIRAYKFGKLIEFLVPNIGTGIDQMNFFEKLSDNEYAELIHNAVKTKGAVGKLANEIGYIPIPKTSENITWFVTGYKEQIKYRKEQIIEGRKRLGLMISKLRKERGLTQAQLADMAGIARPNIVNIEAGKYSPGLDIINKVCMALEVEFGIK